MARIIAILLLTTFSLSAQKIILKKNLKIEDGLNQNTITCAYIASNGIMWFGTQDGVNYYDGYDVYSIKFFLEKNKKIALGLITSIIEDFEGNLLFGTTNGFVKFIPQQNKFEYFLKDTENSQIINCAKDSNYIWCLTNKTLIKIDKQYNYSTYELPLTVNQNLYGYKQKDLLINENQIYISTNQGLIIFNTESRTFYVIKGDVENLSNNDINTIFIDESSNIWLGTAYGLNKINKANIVSKFFYKDNLKDTLASLPNTITKILFLKDLKIVGTRAGLKILEEDRIVDPQDKDLQIKSPITSIVKKDNFLVIATIGEGVFIYKLVDNFFKNFYNFPQNYNSTIFGLYVNDKHIYAGNNNLFIINKKINKIDTIISLSLNYQTLTIIKITKIDNKLWLLTNKFIFILDTLNYTISSFFDYYKIKPLETTLNFNTYDAHKIDNTVWIATENGLFKFDYKKIEKYYLPQKLHIIKILPLNNKTILLATDNGVYKLNTTKNSIEFLEILPELNNYAVFDILTLKDSILVFTTSMGFVIYNLKTNNLKHYNQENLYITNDFFYNVIADNHQNIWLSSNYGLLKFNLADEKYHLFTTDEGLISMEFDLCAAYKYKDTAYFGTVNGITWFSLNQNLVPKNTAKTFINKIIIDDKEKKEFFLPKQNFKILAKTNSNISLTFFNSEFEKNSFFKIIVKKQNKKSEIVQQSNRFNLFGLEPGVYKIQIYALDAHYRLSPTSANITIEIREPFISRSIFKTILTLVIVLTILIISYIFYQTYQTQQNLITEKNKANQQLKEQNIILEKYARNIKESIEYAKNILSTLIQPAEKLQLIIPESFIIFMPKEIIGGDFYWFTKIKDKIFIAAADCTGHGIPGAFLSIIGINTLQKYISEGHSDPAIILNLMNKEIIQILKKREEKNFLKDGVDISLCVIDLNTQDLAYSGAYLPVYVVRENYIYQLKGDRITVGNDFDYNSFTKNSLKLKKNDVIYMFSDGFPDQIGGPHSKKFKYNRFRILLLEISNLPSAKQKEILIENFKLWKGNNEQTDDVLVIGLKPFV